MTERYVLNDELAKFYIEKTIPHVKKHLDELLKKNPGAFKNIKPLEVNEDSLNSAREQISGLFDETIKMLAIRKAYMNPETYQKDNFYICDSSGVLTEEMNSMFASGLLAEVKDEFLPKFGKDLVDFVKENEVINDVYTFKLDESGVFYNILREYDTTPPPKSKPIEVIYDLKL